MLLFGLLARGVEKLEKSKEEMLDRRFEARGCSKTQMSDRLRWMQAHEQEIRRKIDEQQRRTEEAWQAKKGA